MLSFHNLSFPRRTAVYIVAEIFVVATQFVLSGVSPAHAEIVKVTAADGRVSYSDHAPEKMPAGAKKSIIKSYGEVKIKSAAVVTADPEKPKDKKEGSAIPEGALSNADIIKANALMKKQNDELQAKIEKDNCEILKKNLANVNLGRVMTVSEKGEKTFLTDDEVAAEKKKTEASIATVCK